MSSAVTTVILTKNEEKNLARAVRSAIGLGQVTIVDSGSTDETCAIARREGAEVIARSWPGFAAQRRFAIETISSEWILFLDADEEITPELSDEIRALGLCDPHDVGSVAGAMDGAGTTGGHMLGSISAGGSSIAIDGYWIKRRGYFLGAWMRHGAWGRDRVLRLFRRTKASVKDRQVHEEVTVDGKTGELSAHMLHYSQGDFTEVGRKFTAYVPLMAAEIAGRRRSIGIAEICARGIASFVRDYFLRAGFLDGWRGFVLAFWGTASVVAKYSEARRIIETPHPE